MRPACRQRARELVGRGLRAHLEHLLVCRGTARSDSRPRRSPAPTRTASALRLRAGGGVAFERPAWRRGLGLRRPLRGRTLRLRPARCRRLPLLRDRLLRASAAGSRGGLLHRLLRPASAGRDLRRRDGSGDRWRSGAGILGDGGAIIALRDDADGDHRRGRRTERQTPSRRTGTALRVSDRRRPGPAAAPDGRRRHDRARPDELRRRGKGAGRRPAPGPGTARRSGGGSSSSISGRSARRRSLSSGSTSASSGLTSSSTAGGKLATDVTRTSSALA